MPAPPVMIPQEDSTGESVYEGSGLKVDLPPIRQQDRHPHMRRPMIGGESPSVYSRPAGVVTSTDDLRHPQPGVVMPQITEPDSPAALGMTNLPMQFPLPPPPQRLPQQRMQGLLDDAVRARGLYDTPVDPVGTGDSLIQHPVVRSPLAGYDPYQVGLSSPPSPQTQEPQPVYEIDPTVSPHYRPAGPPAHVYQPAEPLPPWEIDPMTAEPSAQRPYLPGLRVPKIGIY